MTALLQGQDHFRGGLKMSGSEVMNLFSVVTVEDLLRPPASWRCYNDAQ
jgi:hypothetical protein